MVSFGTFVRTGDAPIYTQIVQFIRRGLAAGTILSGDELPSRRVLSALLGVNPNTIQKAYHILEEEGIIVSRSGAKSYTRVDESTVRRIRRELMANSTLQWVKTMKQLGVGREEAAVLFEKIWEEG